MTAESANSKVTHFWSGDSRFCGSKDERRAFTFDENEVTCEVCKNNDRLALSPQGQAFVDLIRAAEQRGAAAERAAIVEWLNGCVVKLQSICWEQSAAAHAMIAEAIQENKHHGEQK